MRIIWSATLFVAIGLAAGCKPAAPPVSIGTKPVSVNGMTTKDAQDRPFKPLPEMSWTSLDGAVEKLKDHRGKVVILDFWATYCKPCEEEIPHLMRLKEQYGDDLVLIGLNVGGAEDRPKIPAFVEKLKINYPLASPEDLLTQYVFGNDSAIPQTAIFDRKGELHKKIVGFDPNLAAQLDSAVEEAVRAN